MLKFELEVVAIDELHRIGIRRKRQQGDAWAYKRIIEQVLALSQMNDRSVMPPPLTIPTSTTTQNANQTPSRLQTMV